LRIAAVLVLALAAGCGTISGWRQSMHKASIQRQQNQEAADRNSDTKADKQAKLKLAQNEENLRRLQADLALRSDADSLAASALFARFLAGSTSSVSLDLAARAVAAAPTRADLAYLQLQLCESAPDCDPGQLELRLSQLDPDNGMPWLYALMRAERANANAQWRAVREGLSRESRVTAYWNSLVSHLTAAAAGRDGFDTVAAMLEVVGAESALVPALQPVSRACSVEDVKDALVLAQCRQIAAALMKADTELLEAYGSTLAIRLWPVGSEQLQQVIAQRRVVRYRIDQMSRYPAKFNSPAATRALAGYVQKNPSEQTALRALFVELGVAPDPPAKWVDDAPGG
jgi:hypothetical protein